MQEIDRKEIRGINAKILVTMLLCTASIVATVFGTVQALRNDNQELRNDVRELKVTKDADKMIIDMRIQVLKADVERLERNQVQTKEWMQAIESWKQKVDNKNPQ